MNRSTWASAFAWVEKKVILGFSFLQANLAGIFLLPLFPLRGSVFENIAVDSEFIFNRTGGRRNLAIYADLVDEELNPSDFDGLSWF